MKVEFQQRSWLENLRLVFAIAGRNFLPLFVACLVIGLPAFAMQFWNDEANTGWGPWNFAGYSTAWPVLLDLLEMPFRQAVCLLLVARCYEGVHPRLGAGLITCLSRFPSLLGYSLIASFALLIAILPGCFFMGLTLTGAMYGGEFFRPLTLVFFLCMLIPFVWMFTGLSLGPATIVIEHRDPLYAVGRGFKLASGHRWYLLSFLGLLYLPMILLSHYFLGIYLMGDGIIASWLMEMAMSAGAIPFYLGLELVKTALEIPITIAPVILYFQFKSRIEDLPAQELARLVDQVGHRHDDGGP